MDWIKQEQMSAVGKHMFRRIGMYCAGIGLNVLAILALVLLHYCIPNPASSR